MAEQNQQPPAPNARGTASMSAFSAQSASGYARNNLFSVELHTPHQNGVDKFYNGGSTGAAGPGHHTLPLRIKTAQFPGKSLGTLDLKRFGPQFKIVNDVMFEPVTWTVMCSSDMREWQFFDGWMSFIHGTGVVSEVDKHKMWRPQYYDDYVGACTMRMLDKSVNNEGDFNDTYGIAMFDVYPQSISAIEMSWGSEGQVAEFTVTMWYRYWFGLDWGLKPSPEIKTPMNRGPRWAIVPNRKLPNAQTTGYGLRDNWNHNAEIKPV